MRLRCAGALTGIPASTGMHFRDGAAAIPYLSTGNHSNQADQLRRKIAAEVLPQNPPPIKK